MSEQQLRKALGAVNDLEPPQDDLFVERAMRRGRAKAHRRRSWVVGTAAAVALVGVVGGTWVADHPGQDASTASGSASGMLRAPGITEDNAAPAPELATPGAHSGGAPAPMLPAGGLSGWFTGPMTPVRAALESLAPTLEARFPDIFAGMYAADAGNAHIVVCVTRSDPALQAMVASAVPAGSDVEYRTVGHSIRVLRDAAARIESERVALQARGVIVLGTYLNARTNRVVVSTTGDDHGAVAALVGADVVTVVVDTSHTPRPMLPGGSTQAPLQR
ncbi:MAG: hypothetical protein ACTHJJ_07960 [Intrasporangium sp.]|uniref:hypothetical protein n=1 Tax=Intrasporangium sp. TaxID=1925024 RepID=UPI003F80067B